MPAEFCSLQMSAFCAFSYRVQLCSILGNPLPQNPRPVWHKLAYFPLRFSIQVRFFVPNQKDRFVANLTFIRLFALEFHP